MVDIQTALQATTTLELFKDKKQASFGLHPVLKELDQLSGAHRGICTSAKCRAGAWYATALKESVVLST